MTSLRRVLWCALMLAAVAAAVAEDPPLEDECNAENCLSPDCRCSSTEIPGGLHMDDIPQLIVLTFDEAVTTSNIKFYEHLSDTYNNPNDCRIGMTFFVNHENTDYTLVNQLHRQGHEIGTRSISAESIIVDYWEDLDREGWFNETAGMRDMLVRYALIPPEDIKGFRVPYLNMQGDIMYEVLKEANYTYDSSWTTVQYTDWYPNIYAAKGTLWPYTLDYLSVQDAPVGEAPTASIPGMWVSPITDMKDDNDTQCALLDACGGVSELDSSGVANLLIENFMQHYMSGRSPFGVYTREAFFRNGEDDTLGDIRQEGFETFLNYVSRFEDVYVVTINQLIEWVKDPHSMEELADFEPFMCLDDLPKDNCPEGNHKNCPYYVDIPHELESVYMKICGGECPPAYPWVGNVEGTIENNPNA